MPIFEKNDRRILFVHIPKTGGTSIERWVKKYASVYFLSELPPLSLKVSPQHLQLRELKVLLGNSYWDWGFSIVRCPYKRLESEYFYRTELMFKKIESRFDFSSWVIEQIEIAKKNPFHLDNHLRPQTDFIDSEIDVFRLEDGLGVILEKLGGWFQLKEWHDLEIKNSSNRREVVWSLDAINLVNQFYAQDFELLGYVKKSPKLRIFSRKLGT
jgi:hypothetical protein